MLTFPLLSITIFLPLVGALIIFLNRIGEEIKGERERNAKWVALWTSVVTLCLGLILWFNFNPSSSEFQWVDQQNWIPSLNISYHVGIDGISLPFILLTTFLIPLCILVSWNSITHHIAEYMIFFLILETLLLGVFSALDLILFYVFFESILIPMLFIIGVWGGKNRVYAALKFFLYTFAGSVFMLLAFLYIYFEAGTSNIPTIARTVISPHMQIWLWLGMFIAFAVKIPMWPFHTWLPDAHVEAPTAGSVILAGVLLKMGGYAFLRLSLPLLPEASFYFAPYVSYLSIIAIFYASFIAFIQDDMKKVIAYSSVAHMGFVTLGIFTMDAEGMVGAIFQMFSHGIVSSALFLCIGCLYERVHSREIISFGGLAERIPQFSIVFMVFVLASIGFPGTSGFVGEFLILLGSYEINPWNAGFASFGVFLSAVYMLWLYQRLIFGPIKNSIIKTTPDLSLREKFIFFPLIGLVLITGLYPRPFLSMVDTSVENLIDQYNKALEEREFIQINQKYISENHLKFAGVH